MASPSCTCASCGRYATPYLCPAAATSTRKVVPPSVTSRSCSTSTFASRKTRERISTARRASTGCMTFGRRGGAPAHPVVKTSAEPIAPKRATAARPTVTCPTREGRPNITLADASRWASLSLPSTPMPRFGAIDLGSNALRLRVIEASAPNPEGRFQLALLPGEPSSGWREIASLRAPVRLGAEVFTTGKLAPTSIGQACTALREFRTAMDTAKVDAYRATATSAVREASNGATLVERALRETGIELEIIEGVEEARLIQLAVVRQLALHDRRALLIDVGGGSTELTLLDCGQSAFSMS